MFPRTLFVPWLGGIVFRVRPKATARQAQDEHRQKQGGDGSGRLGIGHWLKLVALGENGVAGLDVSVFVVRHDVSDAAVFFDA